MAFKLEKNSGANLLELPNSATSKNISRKYSDDTSYHSDASTCAGDAEVENSSTNISKSGTPAKNRGSDEYYLEATVKKPKRQFVND